MRKAFIDLGAGSGDDIKGFYQLDKSHADWEIFAFEPNPTRTKGIKQQYPNANVFTAAAGVSDGTMKLYLGNHPNTSSLKIEKKSINKNKYLNVEVIDLVRWMKAEFCEDDQIIMVIDIEGAEYDLLERLREEGMWSWINELYVEFHGEKLANFDIAIENNLCRDLIEFYQKRVYIFRKHQHEKFLRLNAEGA